MEMNFDKIVDYFLIKFLILRQKIRFSSALARWKCLQPIPRINFWQRCRHDDSYPPPFKRSTSTWFEKTLSTSLGGAVTKQRLISHTVRGFEPRLESIFLHKVIEKFLQFLLCAEKLGSDQDSNPRTLWQISRCFVTAPPMLVDEEKSKLGANVYPQRQRF